MVSSGIREPTAPLVKRGTMATAAGAWLSDGSCNSKFSVRIESRRVKTVLKIDDEVRAGMPQLSSEKFAGCDNV